MREETLKGKFVYDAANLSPRDVVLRRPFNWWWLLLLLLLVPLFIRCERTVTVHVVDPTGTPIANADVNLNYTAHYLYNDGFFTNIPQTRQGQTDSHGEIEFADLPCSVFSYIFYTFAKMHIEASSPDFTPVATKELFHWRRHVTIALGDAWIQVIDKISGQPIRGAEVVVTVNGSGRGSFTTRGDGTVSIPDIHLGDRIDAVGRADGYETNDSTIRNVAAKELMVKPPRKLPLQPHIECGGQVNYSSTFQPVVEIEHIDMHQNSGTFTLNATTYGYPDRIEVLNQNGRQLYDTGLFPTADDEVRSFTAIPFDTRYITLRVYSDPDHPTTSNWIVMPQCPDK